MSHSDEKHIDIPYETGESTPYPPAYGDVTQPYARYAMYAIPVQTTRLTGSSRSASAASAGAGPSYQQNDSYIPQRDYQGVDYQANAPSSGPSGASTANGSGSGGLSGMLRNMAPSGQNVASLLDPPPQQFLRAPRADLPYGPFEPGALTSLDAKLDKGFPPLAPPTMTTPHPFATHDVAEDDWQRFLNDVKVASTLSTMDKVKAGVAPMAMGVAPLTGFLVSKGIEKRMRTKKSNAIGELIEHWNAHFFHPRRISVVLAQGAVSYSGPEGVPPPDMAQYSAAIAREEADFSSADEEVHQGRLGGRRERLGALRERRQERRTERRDRADQRRDKRKNRNEMWRLIIAYRPATTAGYR